MTLLYLAGVLSGIVLVVIALGTWILLAARHLKDRHDSQTTPGPTAANTGITPVARHRARRRRDLHSPTARAA